MSKSVSEDHIDVEIRKSIWTGTIPVMFSLAPSEATGEPPAPLFMNIPRNTYFAAQPQEQIKEHFSAFLPSNGGELWMEIRSVPLKWHYPVGVVYDLLAENELPWSITVHFQNFPSEQVIKLNSSAQSNIRSFFMNSLKESTYVKQNGIKVINDFGIKESDLIWEGLHSGSFDKFWNVANLVNVTSSSVPIRVLKPNFPIMQFPWPWKTSYGDLTTLGDVLQSLKLSDGDYANVSIQGIAPPPEAPLVWLSQNLAHPDGFLYIILKS